MMPRRATRFYHATCRLSARVRHVAHIFSLMTLVLGLVGCSSRRNAPETAAAPGGRLADRDLQRAMTGALLWLEDTQIRDRAGRQSSLRDSSSEGDGCAPAMKLSLPLVRSMEVPAPPWIAMRNIPGEWASDIHFYPRRCTLNDLSLATVQDSNLFCTAFTALPLCAVDDGALPPGKRFITAMLERAVAHLDSYRGAAGHGFWPIRPGVEGKSARRGPPNIPIPFVRATAAAALAEDRAGFDKLSPAVPRGGVARWLLWMMVHPGYENRDNLPPKEWLTACLDPEINPFGADALFNIPDDADDTAAAAILRHVSAARAGRLPPSHSELHALSRYRDLSRASQDTRNGWKPRETGAFLTWLAAESDRPFEHPAGGVIPLGTNNVDLVVNANVVHALALAGRKQQPGYSSAVRLLADLITSGKWQGASLYYPQPMMFPYAVTRAYRDGGADDKRLRASLRVLAADLLRIHADHARAHPTRAGAFPGGEDRSEALATALGLTSLLNIGPAIMREIGAEERFTSAVRESARRLLDLRRNGEARDSSTRLLTGKSRALTCSWPGGVFFASSFTDLAHWRSDAHTTAVAFEALSRYALEYDRVDGGAGTLRLMADEKLVTGFRVEMVGKSRRGQ